MTVALLVIVIVTTAACAGDETKSYVTDGYSLAQLHDDFDQYVGLIRRDHPMTFTDKSDLERTIAAQRKLLRDGMSETDFYGVVAPVGAAVRCGHTRTHLSTQGRDHLNEHGLCLPLEIRLINDRLYVYKDFTPDAAILRGSQVMSINAHPATEIIGRMRESHHADGTNITYKDYAINLFFARFFTTLFGGAARFELVIKEPGAGTPATGIVAAISPNQADRVDRERYGPESGCRRLCMSVSDDNSYAVLTIKDFGYYDDVDAFRRPVGDFFARLARDSVRTLIIDVRGNDGGDPYCSSFIASHVISEPVRYFAPGTPVYNDLVRPIPVPRYVFTGQLFVLTDGWCFSSTSHMLSLLRCHRRGVFVGEESGGSSACNDASKGHVMKHTGLELNLPRRAFATSARCLPIGRGIPPDIEVKPTIHDLIAGRDVVLEKAIALIESRKIDDTRKKLELRIASYKKGRDRMVTSENDCISVLYELHCVLTTATKLALRCGSLADLFATQQQMALKKIDEFEAEHHNLRLTIEARLESLVGEDPQKAFQRFENAIDNLQVYNT